MSDLFDRLTRLFDEGHGVELPDLRSDAGFAPAEVRPAAVLIAVTDRQDPGVILTHRPEGMTIGVRVASSTLRLRPKRVSRSVSR